MEQPNVIPFPNQVEFQAALAQEIAKIRTELSAQVMELIRAGQIDPERPPIPKTMLPKLGAIRSNVGRIPKNGYNSFHNYHYVLEADLVEVMGKLFDEQKLLFVPEIMEQERNGEFTKTKVRCYIYDQETGESFWRHFWGEGQDKGDKGLYKAYTGAQKYFLMKTFMIATYDDPENDGSSKNAGGNQGGGSPQGGGQAPRAPGGGQNGYQGGGQGNGSGGRGNAPQGGRGGGAGHHQQGRNQGGQGNGQPRPATDGQIGRIKGRLKDFEQQGIPVNEILQLLQDHYKIPLVGDLRKHLNNLSFDQASQIITTAEEWLHNWRHIGRLWP